MTIFSPETMMSTGMRLLEVKRAPPNKTTTGIGATNIFARKKKIKSKKLSVTWVKVVASAMTKGTLTKRARVFASSVFPDYQAINNSVTS